MTRSKQEASAGAAAARNGKVAEVAVPALVGRKEAAKMLGVLPENLYRDIAGMPRPLQKRRIKGFAVAAGPLWPRSEIEALVKRVREQKRAERDRLRRLSKPPRAAAGK